MRIRLTIGMGLMALVLATTPCGWAQTAEEMGFEAGAADTGYPAGWSQSGVYLEGQLSVVEDAALARTGSQAAEIRAAAGSIDGSQSYIIRQRGANQGDDFNALFPEGESLTLAAWYNVSGFDPGTTQVQPWIYQYTEGVMLLSYIKGDDLRAESNDAGWIQVSVTVTVNADALGESFAPDNTAIVDLRAAHAYLYEAANADGQDAVVLVDDVTVTVGDGDSGLDEDWALYE